MRLIEFCKSSTALSESSLVDDESSSARVAVSGRFRFVDIIDEDEDDELHGDITGELEFSEMALFPK